MHNIFSLWSESKHCIIPIFKLCKMCLMALNVDYLGECSMKFERKHNLLFWMKSSIDVLYIQLIDGPVKFNSVLTDFLPAGSISDRGMLMFLNTMVDSSIFLCSSHCQVHSQ